MNKIMISGHIPEEYLQPYLGSFQFDMPDAGSREFTGEELRERIADCDGCLILDSEVDRELLDAAKRLKVIANFGVGVNNIDLEYATQKKLPVVNTPTQVTEATAEHAAALCISAMRGIARYDRALRRGIWESPIFSNADTMVEGSILGILGFGRIGRRVCHKLQGFGMEIIYYDTIRAPEEIEKALRATYRSFDEVLREADCITLHMPFLPDNRHIINANALRAMKPGAYFVNTARGKLVDEQALADALREGRMKGAALDVYENEPDILPALLTLENVTLTPHIASLTRKARHGMCREAFAGIAGVLNGERPYNVVNPQVF